tara:strand:- start:1061 stop:1645 length:585 start_codon:yes stop_codon:yes gene_type:complete
MSFINKGNKSAIMQEQTTASQVKRSKIQMKIDVVPIPTGASMTSSPEKRAAQQRSINQIKTQGKDLFEVNSTIVTDSGSNRLYQTADLYSESLPLEELIPMLTGSDLTLKLNALRSGKQSSNTCMELKTGHLADIIEKTPVDERNEKMCSVSLQTSKERGSMFVGVKFKGGKHFIQKLDFEIHREEDDKLHVED